MGFWVIFGFKFYANEHRLPSIIGITYQLLRVVRGYYLEAKSPG